MDKMKALEQELIDLHYEGRHTPRRRAQHP